MRVQDVERQGIQCGHDQIVPLRPLSTRLLHWSVAAFMMMAVGSGYAAFDFSGRGSGLLHRDTYFHIHRSMGLLTALIIAAWLVLKWRDRKPGRSLAIPDRIVTTYHVALACVALLIPLMAWGARAVDGRFSEALALLPKFNLVSKADSALAYRMFECHKDLVDVFLIMLMIHIAGAVVHAVARPDGSLSSMLWRRGSADAVANGANGGCEAERTRT